MNNTVIVRKCDEYDPEQIETIVSDGMERLGYRPAGRVFAQKNIARRFHESQDVFRLNNNNNVKY